MAMLRQALVLTCTALVAACNQPPGSTSSSGEIPHAVGSGQTPSLQLQPVNQESTGFQRVALDPDSLPSKKEPDSKTAATAEPKSKREAKGSLSGNDIGFIQRTGNDAQSVEQAALYVASKTKLNDVRNYAAKVGRDHGKANEQLRKFAAKRGIEIPSEPVGQLHEKLNQLRQLSGAKMEQAFLRDFAVQAHMDLITMFELQADQSGDKELREFAGKRLAPLHEFYQQGKTLHDKYAPLTAKLHI